MFRGFWYNVSGFNLDSYHISLICKYFNFKSGTFHKEDNKSKEESFIFSLNCKKNIENLNECQVENFMEFWLDELIQSKITCTNIYKTCKNSKINHKSGVFNYLNSCYYTFKFNKYFTYEQAEKICKLKRMNLLGVSSQDEAKFIENIYLSTYFTKKKTIKNLSKLKKSWKIPTGEKKFFFG